MNIKTSLLKIVRKVAFSKKLKSAYPKIDPDDIFLVSYPKSGNTWIRFLIGNYLSGNKCDFKNSHLIVPDIHYNPYQIDKIEKPRIIKSHNHFCPEYRKVIYLVRDGRDVSISYYYHYLKYNNSYSSNFEEYMKEFNSGQLDFGLWSEHVNSWLDNISASDQFLIIKYEDLKKNTAKTLANILNFSGVEVDFKKVDSSVEASNIKKMQSLEKFQASEVDLLNKSNPEFKFVRSGKIEQWKEAFTENMVEEFLEIHGKALARLNYI